MILNKDNRVFLLILFIWSSLFLSINTNLGYIPIYLESYLIKDFTNARSIFLIISFFIVNFLILFNLKQIFKVYNFFYFLLFSVAIIQGLYFFSEQFRLFDFVSLDNFMLPKTYDDLKIGLKVQSLQIFLSYWVCMFFFFIFNKKQNNNKITFTFIIFILIFVIFYLYLFLPSIYNYISSSALTFYHNPAFQHRSSLLGLDYEPAIRVTGIGRSLLIISIIFLTLFICIRNNIFRNLLLFFIILLNFSIILLGSRFSLYSYFLTYLLFFTFYKEFLRTKIKLLILLIIIPIIFSILTINYKINYLKYNNAIESIFKSSINKENNNLNSINKENNNLNEEKKIKDIRYIHQFNSTTGRTDIWGKLKDVYIKSEKKLLGFGIQADRRLLSQFDNIYGTNSSNGFAYILICSGVIGFLLFLTANIIILKKIYYFIFIQKSFSDFRSFYLVNMSILIILILFQRTLVENSITVFGVDYLLYFVCCYFILTERKTIFIKT